MPDGQSLHLRANGEARGVDWIRRQQVREGGRERSIAGLREESAVGAIVWFGPKCSPDGKASRSAAATGVGQEVTGRSIPAAVQLPHGPDRRAWRTAARPNGLSPSWSPDGRRLAFVDLRGTRGHLLRHANLGRLLLGVDPPRPAQQTQCFAHGDIYFGELTVLARRENEDPQLTKRLTNSSADDESPSWSPDGTEIAYASGPQNAALMAIDVKTRKERLIYRPKNGAVTFVAWAPR